MNIYANPGAKVIFANPNNGSDFDQEFAKARLTIGNTYTVKSTDVGNWSSTVVFEEIPGASFNTVLFNDVPGQEGRSVPKGDTKITRVGNSYAPANNVSASKVVDVSADKDKEVIPHPNVDLNSEYIGNTEGWRPAIGEIIYFPYNYHNGRRTYGERLRTTPIVKIEGDLYYTRNSVYKIEALNENQSG